MDSGACEASIKANIYETGSIRNIPTSDTIDDINITNAFNENQLIVDTDHQILEYDNIRATGTILDVCEASDDTMRDIPITDAIAKNQFVYDSDRKILKNDIIREIESTDTIPNIPITDAACEFTATDTTRNKGCPRVNFTRAEIIIEFDPTKILKVVLPVLCEKSPHCGFRCSDNCLNAFLINSKISLTSYPEIYESKNDGDCACVNCGLTFSKDCTRSNGGHCVDCVNNDPKLRVELKSNGETFEGNSSTERLLLSNANDNSEINLANVKSNFARGNESKSDFSSPDNDTDSASDVKLENTPEKRARIKRIYYSSDPDSESSDPEYEPSGSKKKKKRANMRRKRKQDSSWDESAEMGKIKYDPALLQERKMVLARCDDLEAHRQLSKKVVEMCKSGYKRCDICEVDFDKVFTFKRHMYQFHLRKYSYNCALCGEKYILRSELQKHLRDEHPEDAPHKCLYCEMKRITKVFVTNWDLKQHIKKHIAEGCQFIDHSKPNLKSKYAKKESKIAIKSEPTEPDYKCFLCDFKNAAKNALRDHLHEAHYDSGDPICDFCGATFLYEDDVEDHIRLVECKEKNFGFRCVFCVMVFEQRRHLLEHLSITHFD